MSLPTSLLQVPIRVHAIHLDEDRAVVGPEMDFESLPYFDAAQARDINPDVPYLAESISSPPFEDTTLILKSGVHLHWELPAFLRRTRYGAQAPTEFPPVPTRWLVSRYGSDTDAPTQWVVESDTLRANLDGAQHQGMAQTTVQVDIYSGQRPYTYMGRVEPLAAWLARANDPPDAAYTSWQATHEGAPLTALGWGSPAFDAFYPNCRGVFGIHDPTGSAAHRYEVVGWYADPADDYWLSYLRRKATQWGTAALEALEHLDAAQKEAQKWAQVSTQLERDLGIMIMFGSQGADTAGLPQVREATDPSRWQGMLCTGHAQWLAAEPLPESETLFAMGNTPVEALSALLAQQNTSSDMDPSELEDALSAMLMGDRLKSKTLDIGPKFRALRHADEFVATSGGVHWVVERKEASEAPAESKLPLPLPEPVRPLLEALNAAQEKYDRASRTLERARADLYADWYRYMHVLYPPPGEIDESITVSEVRAMIEAGSLARVERLSAQLPTLESAVQTAHQTLDMALAPLSEPWTLQPRPAARFWAPAAPALLVALKRPTDAAAQDDSATADDPTRRLQPPLSCTAATPLPSLPPTKEKFPTAALHTLASTAPPPNLPAERPIARGEWQVEVYPVATMHAATHPSGRYDPSFMTTNYLLGENEPDLDDQGMLPLAKTGSVYAGAAYVNQKVGPRYRALLEQFLDLQQARQAKLAKPASLTEAEQHELAQRQCFLDVATAAKRFLDAHELLVVTLGGFNAALLQQHESVQLNPADPLGFEAGRAFAQRVAQSLAGNFKGIAPDPFATFMPIRSGALRVIHLRLIDRFGRFRELTPTPLSTARSMAIPGHADWVRLPPRLSQAARWNFRFLQARPTSTAQESHAHPSSSPVHGWLVPNLLDRSLDFFDPEGARLGSVRQRDGQSTWQAHHDRACTGYLKQMVAWITQRHDLLDPFMRNLEEAMDNIHPQAREGQSALAVLVGRPMAIVELGVALELKGGAAIRIGWDALSRDLHRPTRSSAGFAQVQFRYRLGEYRQRNDGLVGYWLLEAGRLSGPFHVNDSVSAYIDMDALDGYEKHGPADSFLRQQSEAWRRYDPQGHSLFRTLRDQSDGTFKKQDLIQPYLREGARVWHELEQAQILSRERLYPEIEHYAEATHTLAPADPLQRLLALVDPHGLIHLSSGIQPVKAIQLPARYTEAALNRLEFSFLTAPLLGPSDQVQLSLPKQLAYRWLWREPNSWSGADSTPPELPETALTPFRTTAFFPARHVLREGELALQHNTDEDEAPPAPDTPKERA